MTEQSLTMMRCELCRAVLASTEAPAMIRAGKSCGVCGGALTLAGAHGHGAAHADAAPAPVAEGTATADAGSVLPQAR